MKKFKSVSIRYVFLSLGFCLTVLSFQNCGQSQFTVLDTITDSQEFSSETILTDQTQGKALYAQHCASCHSDLEVSTLKGRTITSSIISDAIAFKISAMKSLNGKLTQEDLVSIESIFLKSH